MPVVIDLCSDEEPTPKRRRVDHVASILRPDEAEKRDVELVERAFTTEFGGNEKIQRNPQLEIVVDDACLVDKTLLGCLSSISDVTTCRSPSLCHLQQQDKWSCGYRNFQMMLTSLLPHMPAECTCWKHVSRTSTGRITVPDLRRIQHLMESSWQAGFDSKGAKHYKNSIVGKSSWIGAVEVSATLSYLGLDSCVVQFVKCPTSRELLAAFCVLYFTNFSAYSRLRESKDIVRELLRDAERYSSESTNEFSKLAPTLPLYLQWKGHSVTIAGVERKRGGGFFLLSFDPLKDAYKSKLSLDKGKAAPMRLSLKKLLINDWQLVLCTSSCISDTERLSRRDTSAVTAAPAAVMQAMQV